MLVTMFKWSVGLEKDDIYTSIKIAACVCGKDGLISFPEEEKIFQLVSEKSPSFTRVQFDQVIDDFFDSVDQIEDYAEIISDPSIRQFTLQLASKSAGADGLDIRENIALSKLKLLWGEDR